MSRANDGRIDTDLVDEGFCKTCGVELPFCAWYFYDFDRCPDCHLEVERKRVMRVFGSTDTADVIPSVEVNTVDQESDR